MSNNHTWQQAQTVADLLRKLLKHLVTGVEDQAVELPLAQLRVCSLLMSGPQPMSMIGREIGVSQSAITQIADRLERAKLAKRVRKGNDRRVCCLQLTPRGEKMMQKHEYMRISRMAETLAHLTSKQKNAVISAIGLLSEAAACQTDGKRKIYRKTKKTS